MRPRPRPTSVGKISKIHKSLRPSEILKDEKLITRVIDVSQYEYINSFSPIHEDDLLVNVSSGVPVGDSTHDILNIEKMEKNLLEDPFCRRDSFSF